MSKNTYSSVSTLSLFSLSGSKFMLLPAAPRTKMVYNSHRNDCYVFGVMLSEEQNVSVDFNEITIKKQQALIVSPQHVHRPIGKIEPDRFVIAFPPESMTDAEISLVEKYSLNTYLLTLGNDDFMCIKNLYSVLLQRIDKNTEVLTGSAPVIKQNTYG